MEMDFNVQVEYFSTKNVPAVELDDVDGIQELVHQPKTLVSVAGRFEAHRTIDFADVRLGRNDDQQKEKPIKGKIA